jgi:hypothetical protein
VFERYPRKFYLRKDGYQKPVFVCIAESIETPKEAIPSLVRLYAVKNYVCSPYAGQLDFTLSRGIDDIDLRAAEREVKPINVMTGRSDNLNGDMVKSGAEIVNDISYNDGDIVWNGFSDGEFKEFTAGIRVRINDKFDSITAEPFSKARVKFLDMFSGTFAF